MKNQFPAFGEELPHHDLPLIKTWSTFAVGLCLNIQLVGLHPRRCRYDLFGMKTVGESDEIIETCVVRPEMSHRQKHSFCVIGSARFYRGYLEGRIGIPAHGWQHESGCRNTPLG